MLNQCIFVGRLVNLIEQENQTVLMLNIERHESTGHSKTKTYDLIPCIIRKELVKVQGELTIGVLIGVKARVVVSEDGEIKIHADKMTFISAKSRESGHE